MRVNSPPIIDSSNNFTLRFFLSFFLLICDKHGTERVFLKWDFNVCTLEQFNWSIYERDTYTHA